MAGNDDVTWTKRMQDTTKKYADKFHFDSHHSIERFGVICGSFAVAGVLLFGGTTVSAMQSNRADLSNVAQYTNRVETSRTQQEGQVTGIYSSSDDKRVLAMIEFPKNSKVPTQAKDWSVYVSGVKGNVDGKPQRLKQAVNTSIYTFGDSGYMGIYMDAPEGFGKQIVNLTIRSNKELTDSDTLSAEDIQKDYGGDESFSRYDQFRVLLNPTGNEAKSLYALEDPSLNDGDRMRGIYDQAVLWDKERAIRKDLDKSLVALKTLQQRAADGEELVRTREVSVGDDKHVHVIPPVLPPYMVGDSVEGLSSAELRKKLADNGNTFKGIPELEAKSRRAIDLDTYPDGYVPTTYELQAADDVDGAFHFDWRHKTVGEGYINDVVPPGEDAESYITDQLISSANKAYRMQVNDLEWKLSNGDSLSMLDNDNRASLKPLNEAATNLDRIYQDYYSMKRRYQVDGLGQLLQLELELNQVAAQSTVEHSDDNITTNF